MKDCLDPTLPVDWWEGYCTANSLLSTIASVVKTYKTKSADEGWEVVFYQDSDYYIRWGTKLESKSRVVRVLDKETGITYKNKKLYNGLIDKGDDWKNSYKSNGKVYEVKPSYDYGSVSSSDLSGRFINYETIYGKNGEEYPADEVVMVSVVTRANPDGEFWIVEPERENHLGDKIKDSTWDTYVKVTEVDETKSGNFSELFKEGSFRTYSWYRNVTGGSGYVSNSYIKLRQNYSPEATVTAEKVNTDGVLVLKQVTKGASDVYVKLSTVRTNPRRIRVVYGEEITPSTNSVGKSKNTYKGAVRVDKYTGDVTFIDKDEARKMYDRQIDPEWVEEEWYTPANIGYIPDSPPSYLYFAQTSSDSFVPPRTLDNTVEMYISINDKRIILNLVADRSYDYSSSMSSIGYIGRFKPLLDTDVENNFAVTVGADIDKVNINPSDYEIYAKHGKNTSNGMTSVSVLRGLTGLKYQAYYPSYLTPMGKFDPGKQNGSLPRPYIEWNVDKIPGLVYSRNTGKAHTSPIYIGNSYEGYRGVLYDLIVVHQQNVLEGEEMFQRREYGKDWYTLVEVSTSLDFLKYSPTPSVSPTMMMAILNRVEKDKESGK